MKTIKFIIFLIFGILVLNLPLDAQSLQGKEEKEDFLYEFGLKCEEQGNYYKSIEFFKRILQKFPNSRWIDDAAYMIGECYFQLGQYEQALTYYKKAMEESQNKDLSADCLCLIAQVYEKTGDYTSAFDSYVRLTREYPQSIWASDAKLAIRKLASYSRKNQEKTASNSPEKNYSSRNDKKENKTAADPKLSQLLQNGMFEPVKTVEGNVPDVGITVSDKAKMKSDTQEKFVRNPEKEVLSQLNPNSQLAKFIQSDGFQSVSKEKSQTQEKQTIIEKLNQEIKPTIQAETILKTERKSNTEDSYMMIEPSRISQDIQDFNQVRDQFTEVDTENNSLESGEMKEEVLIFHELMGEHLKEEQREKSGLIDIKSIMKRLKKDKGTLKMDNILYEIALNYHEKQSYDRAIDVYQKIITRYPESFWFPESNYMIAECYLAKEEYQQASNYYHKVLKVARDVTSSVDAQYMIAECQVASGEFRKAILSYEKVIKNYPANDWKIDSYYMIGECYIVLKDYKNAAESFRELINEYPDSDWIVDIKRALKDLGSNFKLLSDKEVEEYKVSRDYSNHYKLGIDFKNKNQYKEAIKEFEACISMNPEFKDAYWALGLLFQQEGKYKEAIKSLKRYLEIAPNSPDAHSLLAYIYYHTGDYLEAINEYKQTIKLDPDSRFAQDARFAIKNISRKENK